jgi:transglutaminase-like putative cysteine protease
MVPKSRNRFSEEIMLQEKVEPVLRTDENAIYLAPAEYIDSDHPAIGAFAAKTVTRDMSPAEKAQRFYLAAREIRYDPDLNYSDPEIYRASSVLKAGHAYCVGKAALFAALCRAGGIPARIAFADVTNHLSSEKLRQKMGTNYIAWHGFTEVLLDGRWVKASPTFNSTLCSRFGVVPLEFDGGTDALLQAYDSEGHTFMRYEVLHGTFHDVPAKFLIAEMARIYPQLKRKRGPSAGGMEFEAPIASA